MLYSKAYDLTKFARVHPGGIKFIHDNAGKDATAQFDPVHPKDIMDRLLKLELTMCVVDPGTIKPEQLEEFMELSEAVAGLRTQVPSMRWALDYLSECIQANASNGASNFMPASTEQLAHTL